jgi:predicted amidohydrolase YtcJ
LKSSAIKVHAENAWNTRGASQFVPYLSHKDDKTLSAERRVWWNDREDNVNEPLTWGSYGVQPYRIFDLVQRASMHGIDVVTHVDGARLSKRLTEIYIEALQNHPDARNRIDHFGMMTDETREKVIRYGIPTNATPVFYNEVDAGIGGKDLYAFLPKDYIHEVYGQYSELAQR